MSEETEIFPELRYISQPRDTQEDSTINTAEEEDGWTSTNKKSKKTTDSKGKGSEGQKQAGVGKKSHTNANKMQTLSADIRHIKTPHEREKTLLQDQHQQPSTESNTT